MKYINNTTLSIAGMIVVLIIGIVMFKDVNLTLPVTVKDMIVWSALLLMWKKFDK